MGGMKEKVQAQLSQAVVGKLEEHDDKIQKEIEETRKAIETEGSLNIAGETLNNESSDKEILIASTKAFIETMGTFKDMLVDEGTSQAAGAALEAIAAPWPLSIPSEWAAKKAAKKAVKKAVDKALELGIVLYAEKSLSTDV